MPAANKILNNKNIMKRKTLVFGGTGSVGEIVVKKLIDKGHFVVVLTRQEKQSSDKVQFVVGDVLEREIIDEIMHSNDDVIITLGATNSSTDIMSKGTANIISAMKEKGTKRLICLSTHGAGESWNDLPQDVKKFIKENDDFYASFQDHGLQENIVKKSELEWTIVRPTRIVSEDEKGTFKIDAPNITIDSQISASDIAQFIVNELDYKKFIHKTPMITD